METGRLDKEMIAQPELWKLALLVTDRSLDVALYPPVAREEMIWRSFTYDPASTSTLRAIEDIVYDNPLLLSDFKQVDCIIDNVPSLPLPTKITDEEAARAYALSTAEETSDDADVEMYGCGVTNAQFAFVQPADLKAFMLRTFYNVRFDSRMAALCRYFTSRSELPGHCRIYAPTHGRKMSVIALRDDTLLMANEFEFDTPIDAAYYILASMQQLGLDTADTYVAVGAVGHDNTPLLETLQRFIPTAVAIPFPALRYRATKSTLTAPIDLIIRSICE